MIIVKLMGGLGNQMFQYAAARRLALQHGAAVAFDGSYFEACPAGDTLRKYELHHLAVVARFATPLEIAELSGTCRSRPQRLLIGVRRAAGLACHAHVFREPRARFCPEVLDLPDNVYLCGFWHSERYFADVAGEICEELKVRTELQGINREMAERICSTESVAVHFRRGDYVDSAKTAAYHGVLPLAYYHRALDHLRARGVVNPRLFVFSDDSRWVRDHVDFPLPVEFVDHNPHEVSYEDLRLMTLCRHAIVANSSFSWWGAWLNRKPDKIVVAPRRWLIHDTMPDLIPPGWVRVD